MRAAHREGAEKNPYLGSSFDDFLEAEGLLEEATERAIKAVAEWQMGLAREIMKANSNMLNKLSQG